MRTSEQRRNRPHQMRLEWLEREAGLVELVSGRFRGKVESRHTSIRRAILLALGQRRGLAGSFRVAVARDPEQRRVVLRRRGIQRKIRRAEQRRWPTRVLIRRPGQCQTRGQVRSRLFRLGEHKKAHREPRGANPALWFGQAGQQRCPAGIRSPWLRGPGWRAPWERERRHMDCL